MRDSRALGCPVVGGAQRSRSATSNLKHYGGLLPQPAS
jgi:hypothetical protein